MFTSATVVWACKESPTVNAAMCRWHLYCFCDMCGIYVVALVQPALYVWCASTTSPCCSTVQLPDWWLQHGEGEYVQPNAPSVLRKGCLFRCQGLLNTAAVEVSRVTELRGVGLFLLLHLD
jgi:hypothetical protein